MCNIIPHEIHVKDDIPVSLPHRRVAPHMVQEVKDHLQNLLDQGVFRRSFSSYGSPIVPVRKKDGSLRFCVDYRQLNLKTIHDAFPLASIQQSLEALGGARQFSSLDLAHGYFQVTVHPDSIPLTAFRVPWGLFEFLRLPQGLVNSPSTFQRVMKYVFGDLNMSQLFLYLDDILVFASSTEEHHERLGEVFHRLIQAGLKLNTKKCHLFRDELTYLGHIVSGQGVSVDPGKVNKVLQWPVPSTRGELASFLGLASYYRRFVPGFATVAAPLNALRSPKGVGESLGSNWTPEAESAFCALKKALTEAPVLAYPQYGKEFYLEVDASLQGLGACLGQHDSLGQLHPIAYASRGLRGSEKGYSNYSSFKMELLGLKWAVVDQFGDHIMGHHCVVLTDNNPLAHLNTAKLGATEQRWVAKLAPYDLEIKYRSGRSNKVADALSRSPLNRESIHSDLLVAEFTATLPVPVAVKEKNKVPDEIQPILHSVSGVLPAYSKEQLSKLQQEDAAIGRLWNRKVQGWEEGHEEPNPGVGGVELQGWLREYHRIKFHKGLLFRQLDDPTLGVVQQLLVPEVLRDVLLESAHDK